MSVKMMGMVWDADIKANEKFVLLAYVDHADHDGNNIYPAIKSIARKPRNVQYVTRKLEKAGYLVRKGKGPKGTNQWSVGVQSLQGAKYNSLGVQPSAPEPKTEPPINDDDNIYKLWEKNMGPLTPMIADHLELALEHYTFEWVKDAIAVAVEYGARNWAYVSAVLDNWRSKGRDWTPTKYTGHSKPKPDDLNTEEFLKYVKEQGI